MLRCLFDIVQRICHAMAPVKWVILVIAVALLWKPVSFYFILYNILRPDWDEVTLITSYDTHAVYTEYTEENGRDLAIEALSNIRLGPPFALNLYALYLNGGSNSTEVVVEIHTEDGVDRICFHETSGTKGFIRGAGELYPYFFGDDNYYKMLHSTEIKRVKGSEYAPELSSVDGFWDPNYR